MTLDKLRKYCQDNQGNPKVVVVVGYSQPYALEQHERTDFQHRVGQAKYLETAARTSESDVKHMLSNSSQKTLPENMLRAGLLIQRRSQQLCPVDTSALKSSAYTSLEEDHDEAATKAHTKGEMVRIKVLKQRAKKGVTQ